MSSYTYLKQIIYDVVPFSYDAVLYDLDKLIHFGIEPWKLTHSVFSSAYATLIIDFLYHIWFFLVWGMFLFFVLYRKNDLLRSRFLISFVSCWLLIGWVAATLFSSAGPSFVVSLDLGFSDYDPLIERLQEQHKFLAEHSWFRVWALDAQNMLTTRFLSQTSGEGSGISAMPSMHVSMSVLMALAAYALHKRLGYLMILFAVSIQIGSVHLGWHYAVDGYVSTFLTLSVWKGVGYILASPATSGTLDSPGEMGEAVSEKQG